MPDLEPTGYENKSLKTVIENFLYGICLEDTAYAEVELRRRLERSFPKPDWGRSQDNEDADVAYQTDTTIGTEAKAQ